MKKVISALFLKKDVETGELVPSPGKVVLVGLFIIVASPFFALALFMQR